LSDSKA